MVPKILFKKRVYLFVVLVLLTCTGLIGFLLMAPRTMYVPSDSPIEVQKELPENIPELYFDATAFRPVEYNSSCAKFPKFFELKFTSDIWQTQEMPSRTLHMYSAYLDDRGYNNKWSVRITAMYDEIAYSGTFYCQIWFENKQPVIVQSEPVRWVFQKNWGGNNTGIFHPYIITCPVAQNQIPISVSVVQSVCDTATNNLRIAYKTIDTKKDFVVCVKGLNFPYEDRSLRIIEWIEYLLILGAQKIQFYEFGVHPTTSKVLDYYISRGHVEVLPITLIGGSSNAPKLQSTFLKEKVIERRLQEVIPFNDCLYRNYQEFKFLVILDTDEVIVPSNSTWFDLMTSLEKGRSSYVAQNVYFFDEPQHKHEWFVNIPNYMHMLQHVYRAENYTKPGSFVKAFHDTSRVLLLHNHFPLMCKVRCSHFSIDVNLAHLQHYRTTCVKGIKECESMKENIVMDTRIWNFKEQLIQNMNKTLRDLSFNISMSQ